MPGVGLVGAGLHGALSLLTDGDFAGSLIGRLVVQDGHFLLVFREISGQVRHVGDSMRLHCFHGPGANLADVRFGGGDHFLQLFGGGWRGRLLGRGGEAAGQDMARRGHRGTETGGHYPAGCNEGALHGGCKGAVLVADVLGWG